MPVTFSNSLRFLAIATTLLLAASCTTPIDLSNDQITARNIQTKDTNKALVKQYLKTLGTVPHAAAEKSIHAKNYVQIRQEFENLYDNASNDPVLTQSMSSVSSALTNRKNTITRILGEDDLVAATFRITATHSGNLFGIPATGKSITAKNTGPLYGIPASGNDLDDWELGFASFEGDDWIEGWWFKDELGYLLSIGNQEALNFLVDE